MDDFERELKAGFLDEASQALADTERCFLSLEENPNDADNLNQIFRLAHNLKGSSRAVGFEEMGHFTHHFESYILKIKNGELKATPAVVNLLLRANDHLRQMVDTYKTDLDAKIDSSSLLAELTSDAPAAVEEAPPAVEEMITEPAPEEVQVTAEEPLLSMDDLQAAFDAAQKEAEAVSAAPPDPEPAKSAAEAPVIPLAPPSGATSAAPKAPATEESIRVTLSKVEQLINFIGEMVILQNVLREQSMGQDPLPLRKTVNQLGKVGKEIQDLAMSLRMVPVKPTFMKMQRIVRDTAQALGKDIRIVLKGEETELDKTVLEMINDPLVHLVRNSVDHGIEPAEVRKARGKPEKGTVTLSAYHQSGRLILEVTDDGGGLNAEKLKKKAIEKKLIRPDAQLSEREAYNLIFAPGFSTAEKVTDVSGRGVGMDVVRTNIHDLGGEIQIDSKLEKGTTFRIGLPLTLAIIDAMVMTYNKQRFVIPLGHVHETLQPKENMVQRATGLGEVLLLRGENLPLFRLGDFFGMKSTIPSTQMIAMVIRTGAQPFALLVDDILGQQQVVVKQLSPDLAHVKGVSGTTILGDGKPSLILEPADLLKRPRTVQPVSQGASA